jgi:hypothetical protein
MLKVVARLVLVGVFAVVASAAGAATIKLTGQYQRWQIETKCLGTNDGVVTSGTGEGGYGCKTKKGEVSCDKDGHCTGTCGNCGSAGAPGRRGIGAILSPSPKVQPLEPAVESGQPTSPGGQSPTWQLTKPPSKATPQMLTPQ